MMEAIFFIDVNMLLHGGNKVIEILSPCNGEDLFVCFWADGMVDRRTDRVMDRWT